MGKVIKLFPQQADPPAPEYEILGYVQLACRNLALDSEMTRRICDEILEVIDTIDADAAARYFEREVKSERDIRKHD